MCFIKESDIPMFFMGIDLNEDLSIFDAWINSFLRTYIKF